MKSMDFHDTSYTLKIHIDTLKFTLYLKILACLENAPQRAKSANKS